MVEFNQNQIVVTTKAGDEFRFRVPAPRELAALGLRARALRRADNPDDPGEWGADFYTQQLYRAMALFETLLEKASVTWPFCERQDSEKPVVDSSTFPPESVPVLIEVHEGFADQLATFHKGRSGNGVAPGTENVAG